jgi:hypothetical protein
MSAASVSSRGVRSSRRVLNVGILSITESPLRAMGLCQKKAFGEYHPSALSVRLWPKAVFQHRSKTAIPIPPQSCLPPHLCGCAWGTFGCAGCRRSGLLTRAQLPPFSFSSGRWRFNRALRRCIMVKPTPDPSVIDVPPDHPLFHFPSDFSDRNHTNQRLAFRPPWLAQPTDIQCQFGCRVGGCLDEVVPPADVRTRVGV